MPKKSDPIAQEHIGALIARLAAVLKSEKLTSVMEAVAPAFVAVRRGADKSDPLLSYDEKQFRFAVGQLSAEERDSLDRLCQGYEETKAIPMKIDPHQGEINKRLKTFKDCIELLNMTVKNSHAGHLAAHYDVPLTLVPAMFTMSIMSVARFIDAQGRLGETDSLNKGYVKTFLGKPSKAMQVVASARPEWAPLGDFIYERQRGVFRPGVESWAFTPSHSEIDVFERLKGEKAMAARPDDAVAIPGSLTQSPEEIVPARTGKPVHSAKAARHIRGLK